MFKKICSVGDKTKLSGAMISGTVVLVRSSENLYFNSILESPNMISTIANLQIIYVYLEP